MEITVNRSLNYTNIETPYEEYIGGNYHVYFFYKFSGEVGSVIDLQINTTVESSLLTVTAECCLHPSMIALGNIYAIHVVLDKYTYESDPTRTITVSGKWVAKHVNTKIPFSISIDQTGCQERVRV
jgi:hypothetical protein